LWGGDLTEEKIDKQSILMEEYKLHRQEVISTQGAYNSQISHVQLYGAFIFAGSALILKKEPWIIELPYSAKILGAIIAASLAFYLVSVAMNSSYTFLVLRQRMAEIEFTINSMAKSHVMIYESNIAPNAFGRVFTTSGIPTPVAWSGLWRILLLGGILGILIQVASEMNLGKPGFVYATVVTIVGFILAFQHVFMYVKWNNIDQNWESVEKSHIRGIFRFLSWCISLSALVIISYYLRYGVEEIVKLQEIIGYPKSIGERSDLFTSIYIAVYSALSATLLPTPSEAPLALYKNFDIILLYSSAAFGKGIGSALLAFAVSHFASVSDQVLKFANRPSWLSNFFTKIGDQRQKIGLNALGLYFICQAIPFLPMRTSTCLFAAFYARSRRMLPLVLVVTFVATFFRMFGMWCLIKLGLAVLPSFGAAP
jgi:hypothetical protein